VLGTDGCPASPEWLSLPGKEGTASAAEPRASTALQKLKGAFKNKTNQEGECAKFAEQV